MKRRILTLVIALLLCVGLTVPALAAGDKKPDDPFSKFSLAGNMTVVDQGGTLWMWGSYSGDRGPQALTSGRKCSIMWHGLGEIVLPLIMK